MEKLIMYLLNDSFIVTHKHPYDLKESRTQAKSKKMKNKNKKIEEKFTAQDYY